MHNEQIFTPDWVVNMMLNKIGYIPSADIHDKHIIDNSCGDGAFLVEIVDRYIKHGILNRDISKNELKKGLEKYIHGIEAFFVLTNIHIQYDDSISFHSLLH